MHFQNVVIITHINAMVPVATKYFTPLAHNTFHVDHFRWLLNQLRHKLAFSTPKFILSLLLVTALPTSVYKILRLVKAVPCTVIANPASVYKIPRPVKAVPYTVTSNRTPV